MTGTVPQSNRRLYLPFFGLLLLACLLAQTAFAAPRFPPLTGRVVDDAGMLDPGTKAKLTQLLAGHENATTNQVVVVTLPNLGGYSIADYGYQLGRHWGIGQKGKNNGALLIVAKKERKVRIEVGYGLEGTLTDAICSNIINGIILPSFKRGQFDQGITAGTVAIIQALGGQYKMRAVSHKQGGSVPIFFIFIVFIIIMNMIGGGRRGGGGGLFLTGLFLGSLGGRGGFGGGGFGGGGFGGGGFGGGGGSFGGGGASGGW